MSIRKSALATAISLVVGVGFAGQATASVYAGSRLLIEGFSIITTIPDPAGGADIVTGPESYTFRTTNTAQLNNGAAVVTTDNCGGDFLVSTTCGAGGVGTEVLDPLPAEVIGSGPARVNNAFTYLGPGMNEYASSDSAIITAELVDPTTPTEIGQIAESEIDSGVQAFADSVITSQTDYTVDFNILPGTGPWKLVLDFNADADLLAQISDLFADGADARASIAASFSLTQNTLGDASVSWAPQGSIGNNCGVTDPDAFGIACTEDNDGEDLNKNVSTATVPTSVAGFSRFADAGGGLDANGDPADMGFSDFGITITGLTAGEWSLSLASTLTSDVSRTVPEPGLLALLGVGLVGFARKGMRARKQEAS